MKKTYYLFNPGRLSRQDNTLKFLPIDEDGNEGQPRYLPVETIDTIYCFGSLDANSAMYNFLGKHHIAVHFFDYYEHYTGSFMPKDYLLAGKMQVEQTKYYLSNKKRILVAQKFVLGGAMNMLKNLQYYSNRQKEVGKQISAIQNYITNIEHASQIDELMVASAVYEHEARVHSYEILGKLNKNIWSNLKLKLQGFLQT